MEQFQFLHCLAEKKSNINFFRYLSLLICLFFFLGGGRVFKNFKYVLFLNLSLSYAAQLQNINQFALKTVQIVQYLFTLISQHEIKTSSINKKINQIFNTYM